MPIAKTTRPATLNDVASEAGVSLATAARVLRGDPYPVAPERKQRVLKAAEKLRYVPNLLARTLRGGSHRSVGLIVGNMSNPYFGEIAQTVSVTARSRSLVAVVANMHRDPQLEITMCKELRDHRVNGVILAGGAFDQATYNGELLKLIAQLKKMNIVVVSLTERSLKIPCFSADNEKAGRMAAEHLLENGHIHIGIIAGSSKSEVTRRRLKGINQALAATGVKPAVAHTDMGISVGEEALSRLFALEPRITAIITSGDSVGIGTVHQLHHRNCRVPDDISVLSVGKTYLAQLSAPRLTAIDLHLSDHCAAAVNYISDALDGRSPPATKALSPSLVPGQSVRAVAKQRKVRS